MTDRELLELAAKAVGICHEEIYFLDKGLRLGERGNGYTSWIDWWNPLNDDGDALRLSASLHMGIEHNLSCDEDLWVVVSSDTCKDLAWEEFEAETDRISATRRAIVRAAAEIGKSMKEGQ